MQFYTSNTNFIATLAIVYVFDCLPIGSFYLLTAKMFSKPDVDTFWTVGRYSWLSALAPLNIQAPPSTLSCAALALRLFRSLPPMPITSQSSGRERA